MPEPRRYKDPTLQNHLASRYVLGKMQGRAKLRFEKLITLNQVMARRVKQWEIKVHELERLNEPELNLSLPKNAVDKLIQQKQNDTSLTNSTSSETTPSEGTFMKFKKQIWLYRLIAVIGILSTFLLGNAFFN